MRPDAASTTDLGQLLREFDNDVETDEQSEIEDMNHTNFDWYASCNPHCQKIEKVRPWYAGAGVAIELDRAEETGITIVAERIA